MIFALPPPPPFPSAVIFAVETDVTCHFVSCASSAACALSPILFLSKRKGKLKAKKEFLDLFIVCTLQRRRRRRRRCRGGGRGGAKSINKTRHFRSVVNYVIFRIYTRKLDSTRRFVLYLRDLSSFFIAVPSSSSFSRHFSHKDPLFLASQPTRNY